MTLLDQIIHETEQNEGDYDADAIHDTLTETYGVTDLDLISETTFWKVAGNHRTDLLPSELASKWFGGTW